MQAIVRIRSEDLGSTLLVAARLTDVGADWCRQLASIYELTELGFKFMFEYSSWITLHM